MWSSFFWGRSGKMPPRLSACWPDDRDLCDYQSFGMAGLFDDRISITRLEGRPCFGRGDGCGLRYGIAIRTQRGRFRLLGGADVVGYSAYLVVRTRYGDFRPRYSGGGEPPAGLRHPGWRASLWCAINLRPICFSFASACSRKRRTSRCVLRDALVCRRAEVTLSGSSWWIQEASISCIEDLGMRSVY